MIHYNLTSHIVLNKVSENLYHPKTAVERSELTRFEKIRTDIFPKSEDAVDNIADAIEREIKDKAQGKQTLYTCARYRTESDAHL